MYPTAFRSGTVSVPRQAAALLALGAFCYAVAAFGDPILVPLAAIALIGLGILLQWPHVGILLMFAMVLFKPEALQGAISVNAALAAALAPSLFLDLTVRRQFGVLKSTTLRMFALIGLVLAVNWYFVGRIDAPAYLVDLDQSTRSMFRFAFHLVFMTLLIAFIRTPGQLRTLTALFLLSVFYTIPGAMSKSYSGPVPGHSAEAMRAAAVAGVQAAENANRLAFIALMGIALIWFWLREPRAFLVRLGGLGLMLVLVLTVFLSGSRSGLLNLGLLMILMLVRSRPKIAHVAAIVLMAFLVVGIAIFFVPQPILDRITALAGSSEDGKQKGVAESTFRRQQMIKTGLTMFSENPFMGVGVGNFRWMTAIDPRFGGIVAAAHNAYLLALAEGGIILFGVHLLLFWVTARNLRWTQRQAPLYPHLRLEWLIHATRANLTMLLVFSLFAEAWKEFYFLLILATAGILTEIYRRESAASGREPEISRREPSHA